MGFAHGYEELRSTPAFVVAPLSKRLQVAKGRLDASPLPEGIVSGTGVNPQDAEANLKVQRMKVDESTLLKASSESRSTTASESASIISQGAEVHPGEAM